MAPPIRVPVDTVEPIQIVSIDVTVQNVSIDVDIVEAVVNVRIVPPVDKRP